MIESRAKMRLADEYDDAQERGDVRRHGERGKDIPDENVFSKPTITEAGISSKQIYEDRRSRRDRAIRKDFLPSELEAIRRSCEALLRQQASERQAAAGPASGRGAKATASGKLSTTDRGTVRDKIGAFAGVSGRTVEKIAAVVEAAEAEPVYTDEYFFG